MHVRVSAAVAAVVVQFVGVLVGVQVVRFSPASSNGTENSALG